ncbi:MAG: polyprenyl synthetase family protein [Candidatus Bathyarchaeia archaeon]
MADLLSQVRGVGKEVDDLLEGIVGGSKEVEELYKAAKHVIRVGGKRVRPFIVVRSCEAVGGDPRDALRVAAGLELLHTFTLIHDDIMDRDETRRGVPTVHKVWGIPMAIVAGDLLFAKVYEALIQYLESRSLPPSTVSEMLKRVTDAVVRICEGQMLDFSYERRLDATEEDYLKVIERKTAALFEVSAEVGGLVGGGSAEQVEALGQYGLNAGIAFQLVDDVLGMTGDESALGKPIGSDVREGKMTLMIIHALKRGDPSQRERIGKTLGDMKAKSSEVSEVIEIVRSLGSIDFTLDRARSYVAEAKRSLRALQPSKARRDLAELADFFVSREY